MQITHLPKKKQETDKRQRESFEKEQKEAFRQFMKTHATDPLFQECVMKLYL